MKFIHTADWQIGLKANQLKKAGEKVRETRFKTIEKIIQLALQEQVDFILVCGDIFDHNAISEKTIFKLISILKNFTNPIYLLPGNHDPFVYGSVWEKPIWSKLSNIIILKEKKPIERGKYTLYPEPVIDPNSTEEAFSWVQHINPHTINIGLAHHNLVLEKNKYKELILTPSRAKELNFNYLALGHWHSLYTYSEKIAYSGSPEPTKFGEDKAGHVLLVEIKEPQSEPHLSAIKVGEITWLKTQITLLGTKDINQFQKMLEELPANKTILELELTGNLTPSQFALLQNVLHLAEENFLEINYNLDNLSTFQKVEEIIEAISSPLGKEIASFLEKTYPQKDKLFTNTLNLLLTLDK